MRGTVHFDLRVQIGLAKRIFHNGLVVGDRRSSLCGDRDEELRVSFRGLKMRAVRLIGDQPGAMECSDRPDASGIGGGGTKSHRTSHAISLRSHLPVLRNRRLLVQPGGECLRIRHMGGFVQCLHERHQLRRWGGSAGFRRRSFPTAEEFALTTAPVQPEAQRFHFEPGATDGAAPAAISDVPAPTFAERFHDIATQQAEVPASAASLLELKPLGQVNASFIVAVNGEGLWLIDQHVAHERILFEQHLQARRAGQLTGQRMLVPIVAELSPRQLVTFERIAEELSANRFEVSPMGPRTVAIQAAPAGIASADAEKLLLEILDGIERENSAISIDTLQAKIAASDLLPRRDQSEHAARSEKDGVAARRTRQDRRADELPARPAGRTALFAARDRAGVQTDLRRRERLGIPGGKTYYRN